MICAEERLTFVGEDDIEIEMRVPQEAVKFIIGRQGANIKQVSVGAGNLLFQGLILLSLLCPYPPKSTHIMYILNRKKNTKKKQRNFLGNMLFTF